MGKRLKKRFKKLCCWKKTSSDSSDSEGEDTVQPIDVSQHVQQQPVSIKVHAKSHGEDAKQSVHASEHVQQQDTATKVQVIAKSAKKKGKSRKPSKEESLMIKELDEQSQYLSKAIANVQSKIKDLERLNEETRQKYQALKDITSALERSHGNTDIVHNQVELTPAQEHERSESMYVVPRLDILAEHRLFSGLDMNVGPLDCPSCAPSIADLYPDTSERFIIESQSILMPTSTTHHNIYESVPEGNFVFVESNPQIHTLPVIILCLYRDSQGDLNANIPISNGRIFGNTANTVVKPSFENPFVQPLSYALSQIVVINNSIACRQQASGTNIVTEVGVQLPVVPYTNAACYDPYALASTSGDSVVLGMNSCWVQLYYNTGIDVRVALELMAEIGLGTDMHGTCNTRIIFSATLDQFIKICIVVYIGFKQSQTRALMSSSDSEKGEHTMSRQEGLHGVLLKMMLQLSKIIDALCKKQNLMEAKQQQVTYVAVSRRVSVEMERCVTKWKQASCVAFLAHNIERNAYMQQMNSSIWVRPLDQVKQKQMKMRCIQPMAEIEMHNRIRAHVNSDHPGKLFGLKANYTFVAMLAHHVVSKVRSEMLAIPQAILTSVNWKTELEPRRQYVTIPASVPRALLQSYQCINKQTSSGSIISNHMAVDFTKEDVQGTILIVLVSLLHWRKNVERQKQALGDANTWSLRKSEHPDGLYAPMKLNTFDNCLMVAKRRIEMIAIPQAILASVIWKIDLKPRRQCIAIQPRVPRILHQNFQSVSKQNESGSVRSDLKAVDFKTADVAGTTLIVLVSMLHWAKYLERPKMALGDANVRYLKKLYEHPSGLYVLKANITSDNCLLFKPMLTHFMVARRRIEMLAIPQAIPASVTWNPVLEPRRELVTIPVSVPRILLQSHKGICKQKGSGSVLSKHEAVAFTKADVVGTTLIIFLSSLHWAKNLERPNMSLGAANILSAKKFSELVVRSEKVFNERNDNVKNLTLKGQGISTYKGKPHVPNGIIRTAVEMHIANLFGHFGGHDQEAIRRHIGATKYGGHRSRDVDFKASPKPVESPELKRSPRMNDDTTRCGSPSSEEVHKMEGTVRGARSPRTSTGSPRVEDFSRLDGSPRADGPSIVKVKGESLTDITKLVSFESAIPEVIQDPMKEYRFSLNKRPMLSLRDLINKGVRFDESHAQFLGINLLLTLQFLLARRIIHADINPGKVVFNDKGYPCLIGFENSEVIGSNFRRDQKHTIPQIEYCSPEQLIKQGPVTEATDIFSTGVLLFTMMFGRSPHKDINYQKTKANLLKNSFVPRFKPDGTLSWRGKLFVSLCLRKDPIKRFRLQKCQSSVVDSVKWFKGYDETALANQIYPSPFIKLISDAQTKPSANQIPRSIHVPQAKGRDTGQRNKGPDTPFVVVPFKELIPGHRNKGQDICRDLPQRNDQNSGQNNKGRDRRFAVPQSKDRHPGQRNKRSDHGLNMHQYTGGSQDSTMNKPGIPLAVCRLGKLDSGLPQARARKPDKGNKKLKPRVAVSKDTEWNEDSTTHKLVRPPTNTKPYGRKSRLPQAVIRKPCQRHARPNQDTAKYQYSDMIKSHLPLAVHRDKGQASDRNIVDLNRSPVTERNNDLTMNLKIQSIVASQATQKKPVRSNDRTHVPFSAPRVNVRGPSHSQSAIPVIIRSDITDRGKPRDVKKSFDI